MERNQQLHDYLTRERSLFYVICPSLLSDPYATHTVCADSKGTFFWGHASAELVLVKAEVELTPPSDVVGCYGLASLWTSSFIRPRHLVIQENGIGLAYITVGFDRSPSLLMYASKADAFRLKNWFQGQFPGVMSRWDR